MDKKVSKLLNQSKGSIEKVATMLENERNCYAIIQQINASQGLLEKAKQHILKNHLDSSIDLIESGDRSKSKELYKLFNIKV